MRKIEAQMINAVRACLNGSDERWRSGNTVVFVYRNGIHGTPSYERIVCVELHGNVIAEFDSALCGARDCRGLKLFDRGWQTSTTKSRLNALLGAFTEGGAIHQIRGEWYSPRDEQWHGEDWFSYGIRDCWQLKAAERIGNSKPRIENAYDADWQHTMAALLATAKRFPATAEEPVITPGTGIGKAPFARA